MFSKRGANKFSRKEFLGQVWLEYVKILRIIGLYGRVFGEMGKMRGKGNLGKDGELRGIKILSKVGKDGGASKICRSATSESRRGTLLSKPASGRAAANASATCDSTSFDARFRSSRRSASPRTFVGGRKWDFPFSSPSSVAAIVATCRLFRVDRRNAFAARRVGSARNIPLFRTALGSTFRPRSAEGASDSSRRRPDRRTSRFSMQAALFENVKNVGERGKGACNSRR